MRKVCKYLGEWYDYAIDVGGLLTLISSNGNTITGIAVWEVDLPTDISEREWSDAPTWARGRLVREDACGYWVGQDRMRVIPLEYFSTMKYEPRPPETILDKIVLPKVIDGRVEWPALGGGSYTCTKVEQEEILTHLHKLLEQLSA